MCDEQRKLFMYITEVSFTCDDARLYLDTHPDDTDALEYFKKFACQREEALKEYAKAYGPLRPEDIADDCAWTWIDQPWPWKGAC